MPQTNVLHNWTNTYPADAPVQKPGGVVVGAALPPGSVPNKPPGYAAPPTTPPVNTSAPIVSGSTVVGSSLYCTQGAWSPTGAFTYQWQSGGANIPGQTGNYYTTQTSDVGKSIICVVTATNALGSTPANSNAIGPITNVPPVNTVAPVVTGSTVVGSVLTCTSGTWSPSGTFTYQWQSGGSNISGQTGTSYTTQAGDVGNMITCIVTCTGTAGPASASSNAVGPITSTMVTGSSYYYLGF